jgi:hypothetical protein
MKVRRRISLLIMTTTVPQPGRGLAKFPDLKLKS